MKNAIVFLFIFLGFSLAQAKTEMTLFVSNHLGFRKQEVVLVESDQMVFYNGIRVPKKLLTKIQKPLATLQGMPQEKRKFCYKNQYTYTVIADSGKKEIHACAEGKEFARFAMAFSNIQQVLLGNRN